MTEILSATPYDDAYRTMYVECDELVLPLLNEVFGEHYTGKEKIVRLGNEHFSPGQDGAEEKRITDSFLEVRAETSKKYHCECESQPDGTIVIRMFQYGAQLALVDSKIMGNELFVEFPNAAVLFLRSPKNMTDMKIHIKTPGGDVSYEIETLRVSDYSIDMIFEKRLYFLIPFYVFNLEKDLKHYNNDAAALQELLSLYRDIQSRMEALVAGGTLTSVSRTVITDLSNKVAQNLTEKYENVRKGIGDIMGGRVLDLEVFHIRDEGRVEGRQELIVEMLRRGKSPEEIADFTGIPLETIQQIEAASLQPA